MSNIEWTDATWNPVVGCTPVSPGCLNCYAATMARRLEAMGKAEYQPRDLEPHDFAYNGQFGRTDGIVRDADGRLRVRIAEVRGGRAVFTGEVRTLPDRLAAPLSWKKPRRVFVNSMSDLFHEAVPFEFIDRVFAVMALCRRHTFQVLTKRPERMAEYLNGWAAYERVRTMIETPGNDVRVAWWKTLNTQQRRQEQSQWWTNLPTDRWPLPNVWLGTSVENQATADERLPYLVRCQAAVRFVSGEPLLGAVDLTRVNFGAPGVQNVLDCRVSEIAKRAGIDKLNGVDWVIVGGESGPNARPCDVGHVRSVVQQCKAAGVPVFVKQLGVNVEWWSSTPDMKWPEGTRFRTDESADFMRVRLRNRKGGDPAEWPDHLRVREMPGEQRDNAITRNSGTSEGPPRT